MRTTIILLVAALCVAGPAAAEPPSAGAQLVKALDTFQSICLAHAPTFPKDAKVFASRGYVKPTQDPAVFEDAVGGLAGLGYAGVEGGPTTSPTPNGCLVYFKGLDAGVMAALTHAAMAKRFKLLETRKVGGDSYWVIRDFAPRIFVAFVAPKPEGTYAGRTLLMITEQRPPPTTTPKTPPIVPKDPAEAAKVIEELRKMSPEERMAHFGSLQFALCLFATDFLEVEFEKGLGVERVPSSVPGQNQFMDSTTGIMMMTNARQCMVAYPGTNVEVSLGGITPFVSLRDKNAQTSAWENGYIIKLNLSGKPHVISIARGQVQGRNLVRMMLEQAPPQ